MINASDFRNGVTIEMDNGIWTIVSFLHVKPGKGAAFVRTKLKNIVTGAVIERTFNPTACTMGFTIGRWGILNAGTTSLFSSALRTTTLASKGNTSLISKFLFPL